MENPVFENVRVFSEYVSRDPSIIELVDISTYYQKEGSFYGALRDAKARVPQIIERLLQRPPGERAVEMYYLLSFDTYDDKGADALAVLEKGYIDVTGTVALLKPISNELKKRRIPIDLMYVDNEGGFGYFTLGKARLKRIFRSARARRLMPPECRAINPEDFDQNSPNFFSAVTTWDAYARRIKYDALRKVIFGSGLFDIKQRPRGPIVRPSAVNFWSVAPTFPIYDYNGWRQEYTSLDGISSGPSCYVGTPGSLFQRRIHHWKWNSLIQVLNQVRSCLGRANARVHPVISNPGLCHPWLWEEMIAHMVRSGITWTGGRNAFIYWNANSPTTQDPLAAQIVARHDLYVEPQRNLPEIPLDVDTITTGDWTTTYEQFLENMGDALDGGGGG